MINKHNNISSQDALFNNVKIRDTLKSDSIEANQIIRSANPGSTGRVILNGTLTVLGNDNSIDTIKNVNITNNELEFTNELGTTTANKITQENGTTNITGGTITFNHTLEVTGDNNNVTTISDANITNNKEIEFINENGNTTADNITGESTITNGNISFNHVVTVKNQQDNQNNITSITDSNITNNKEMKFTNQTANSLIDNITGESTINSGNISFDNIVTVKNQQENQNNITSINDSNITNNNLMSFTNQTANTTIDTLQDGEGNLTITGGNITSNNVVTVKNQQNDNNNITSITNSTITNDNEIKLTNPTANTIIDTLQNGEGNLTITGGNITSNNVVTIKNQQNDNNNITSITDSNLTNNNSLTFTKQTANTAIDTLQAGDGELTITGGDITFDNVVTIKNQQDNQNNITSITNSNINNNNSMSFTNETANTTIDTLQKGEGDLTITGGNINTNNIITVTDQSVITSLTNANITNTGTFTLNNASIDQLITSTINGPKTENDSLEEIKFKYKEETLKKSTDTVTGTKYYNIPYVKVLNNVTYYGELFNKTEELNTSYIDYDMKYYYADIIYYQYQNKIIIPENQSVTVNKADQISLVNADVTNNGTLNISDGSVIQEIIGDVKFSGKVNLEAVTEIRDVDNIILEEAIITNNKGITITNESTISSIRNSNIGGDVTIDTKGNVTVENVTNSTITNGTVTINDNITSTVINSNLVGGTVNFGENKTLTVEVKEGALENEIIKTITDSTINNVNVTLNNNITSTVTNSDLNATTIDLNNNTLTTKEGVTSSFDNINNSTITNGDVLVNNNLDSLITNSILKDNVTIDLNTNSLNAKTNSTVSKIDNSTITNGNVAINNDLDSLLTNTTLSNIASVDLNIKSLNAKSGSSVDNINNSTLTNGNVTVNNNLESLLTNVSLNDNVNVDLNTKSLNAKTDSTVSNINNSTITNGNVLFNNNLTSTLTDVILNDNVTVDLNNTYSLTTKTGTNSTISNINNSTITNGNVSVNNDLNSVLANVTLSNITEVDLNSNLLTANSGSSVSNINNSTITSGNVSVSNDLTVSLANVTLNNIGNVNLNDHSLTANNESTVSNINNSTITNGDITVSNNLDSLLTNVVLGDNVNNDVKVNLNSNTLTANNGSSISDIKKSTITNGTVTIKENLSSTLANVVLGDNVNNDVKVNLNDKSLTAEIGSSISEINKSTITNGDITVNNNLDSLLTDVVLLGDNDNIVKVDLKTKSLNAKINSSVSEINNSTITNGTVAINENLSSLLTDVTLKDNVNVNLNNTHSLTANSGSSVSNINNSTITNGDVLVNDNLTSKLTNVSLSDNVTVDLNNTYSITANNNSTVSNINNSTITNGDVLVNNNLTSSLANVTLSDNVNVDLNGNILTANNESTISNINNSTVTNGTVTIKENLSSSLANVVLGDNENNNVNVNLSGNTLTAETGSSISDIKKSTVTNGNVAINDNLNSLLTNAVLGDNVNNDVKVNLNDNSLTAKTGSSISDIKKSTITNGDITINDNLSSLLTNVVLGDNVNNDVNVDLNTKSLNATAGSSISNIKKSTITNGNVAINENLSSLLTDVTLNNIASVDLNSNTLTANNDSTVSNITNSTITDGNVLVKNNLTSSLTNVTLKDNVTVDLNNTYSLTANSGSSVSNINNSTVTDGNVSVNNDLNPVLTNVTLNNIANVDLNTHLLTTKTGTNSTVSNINNSTITDGNIAINNDLNTVLTNVVLGDNVNNNVNVDLNSHLLTANSGSSVSNINKSTITDGNIAVNNNLESLLTNVVLGDNANVNLSSNSLNAKSGSSISNIKNSTLTNGTLTINNDITSQVTNSSIENGTVDLNNHKLTASGDITLSNITGGVITNTGAIEANGTITANQINSNLLKDQTGTNQIMAYDKDNKKITFCNHTTLTCSGEEDTLTTDNLVIDRITLNEVREVDGGIVTTNLKVGTPYTAELDTDPQDSFLNVKGNILHVIIQSVNNVDHYFLLISTNDIENSLKSDDTKIIAKGADFNSSELISSIDQLTLETGKHLYIKAEGSKANGLVLNDRSINASIDEDGTINGKSLQLVNASINNGAIIGKSLQFDYASIDNEGVITGKSLQTNQILNENGNKSIINYDPVGTGTKPKITLGAEGVDLEIVGFDQENIDCDTLTAQTGIYTNSIYSNTTPTQSLFNYDSSSKTITIGNSSDPSSPTNQKTGNLTVANSLISSTNFYSNKMTSINNVPLLNYTVSPDTITIGNNTTNISIPGTITSLTVADRIYVDNIYSYNNKEYTLLRANTDNDSGGGALLGKNITGNERNHIFNSIVIGLYGFNRRTRQVFGEATDSNVADSEGNTSINYVFFGNSKYAYTLIHNLRTNEPLYTPSISYWPKNTAKSSAIPLLDYNKTNSTITLGNATTKISIPGTVTSLKTNSIIDSETDSIISVDTDQGIITIGNDNKQTIIKNADYSDIFNKIYVSIGQNIKFKIDPKIAIDKAIKTVNIASVTVTKDGTTTTKANVTAYQNADNIYNNYTTGQIFLDRLSTSTDTTTEVDVYIIPKKRNFFDHETNTGAFYTKQTARMCFVFCNLYFIIKSPSGDETSSGLWTSSNGNVWYEFSPKDFNNQTGPYSNTTVSGAKFDISKTKTIDNLSIGYIPRGWMTGYEVYEDHYVLGFPLITVSNEAYYAAFLLYDYDEYMTREVTYDGGCTIL